MARTTARSWLMNRIGQAVRGLQVAQQLDDLLLHGTVERRGRLVQHDDAGLQRRWRGRWRCAGAGRPRIRADSGCAWPGRGRPPRSASTARLSRSRGRQRRLVHEQALGDDLADGHARRERAERVLEDQLQFACAAAASPARSSASMSARRRSGCCPSRRQQPQQRAAERRLAGAGSADDADRLALR